MHSTSAMFSGGTLDPHSSSPEGRGRGRRRLGMRPCREMRGSQSMPKQPNILFLFTDQHRGDSMGCAGHPIVRTPNLDRIAAEGTRFTSAFTPSPVCVSARCSLILGQYPHTTGCLDNGYPMPTDRPTLMERLGELGYQTQGVGKMHFSPDSQAMKGFEARDRQEELCARVEDDDYVQYVQEIGFDHILDIHGVRGEMYYVPQVSQLPAEHHPSSWIADRSVDFLRRRDKDRPFFLWSSWIHPHPPVAPPNPWYRLYRGPLMPPPKVPEDFEAMWTYWNRVQNRYKYRDRGWDLNLVRQIRAYYWACVSFVDYNIGRVLAELEAQGELENTIIMYSSDHGEALGDYRCFGKRSFLNSQANIPMILRHPGRIAAGEVCDTPVSLVDVLPTLVTAAGGEVHEGVEGADLARIAAGEEPDRTVYGQIQGAGLGVHYSVSRDVKYAYSEPDDKEYLILRRQDPDEMRNHAYTIFAQDILRQAREDLFSHYREVGFTERLEGDGWKRHPRRGLPDDPDAGLLQQDTPWSKHLEHIEGYG
ncbi:MAG: sulfatase-like hydrolase/transferase, partial [Armatimonadia bacterium]|nr:sulfatase-like hydrolase/transferase [Armatimonadia bacterium]